MNFYDWLLLGPGPRPGEMFWIYDSGAMEGDPNRISAGGHMIQASETGEEI